MPIDDRVQSHVLCLEPDSVPEARRNHARQAGGQGLGPQSRPAGVSPLPGRAWQHPGRGLSGRNWVEQREGPDPLVMRPVTGAVPSVGLGPASGAPPAECPFPDSSFLRFSPGLGDQLGGRGTRPGSRRGAALAAPARECICPAIHSGSLVEAAPEPGWGEPRGSAA